MILKTLPFAVSFAVMVCSCASIGEFYGIHPIGEKKVANGYTIEVVENGIKFPTIINIEYESYEYLVTDIRSRMKKQLIDEETIEKELLKIPKGGIVIFKLQDNTIEKANPKGYSFMVSLLDSTEVLRIAGEDKIPNYSTPAYGTEWYAVDVISISDSIQYPFLFYIFNRYTDTRNCFKIYPNKAPL